MAEVIMNKKPLGIKNYGSIPHLPGSRMGPADHSCHEGQERICNVKKRDKNDIIIVQEKLDGSNVGVCKVNNEIVPLTRAGYHANTSPYEQHHKFAKFVDDNKSRFDALLKEGERCVGEWLIQAHGTRYELMHEPFVLFDIMNGNERCIFDEVKNRAFDFILPKVIHIGDSLSIDSAMELLGDFGFHGAIDKIEGAVWRVERFGKVDFLAKYVRKDKIDGCYLESYTGKKTIWNRCNGV